MSNTGEGHGTVTSRVGLRKQGPREICAHSFCLTCLTFLSIFFIKASRLHGKIFRNHKLYIFFKKLNAKSPGLLFKDYLWNPKIYQKKNWHCWNYSYPVLSKMNRSQICNIHLRVKCQAAKSPREKKMSPLTKNKARHWGHSTLILPTCSWLGFKERKQTRGVCKQRQLG